MRRTPAEVQYFIIILVSRKGVISQNDYDNEQRVSVYNNKSSLGSDGFQVGVNLCSVSACSRFDLPIIRGHLILYWIKCNVDYMFLLFNIML